MKKIKVDYFTSGLFVETLLIAYLTNKPHDFDYLKIVWLRFNKLEIYNYEKRNLLFKPKAIIK